MHLRPRVLTALLLAAAVGAAACSDSTSAPPVRGFLEGTSTNPDIAAFVNGSANTLLMLQLGAPDVRQELPLGAGPSITPVGFAVRGKKAMVPLGNAGSVALVDLETNAVERTFTFATGNATGVAWINDTTVIVANQLDDYVGRIFIHQAGTAITDTLMVTPFPTDVQARDGKAYVVSSNLDENYAEIGDGVVTVIDPVTMTVLDSLPTGGRNPQFGAFGPDGRFYVVNTGEYFPADAQGSLAVYAAGVNAAPTVIDGFGNAPGPIAIDAAGRAVISSFSFGSIVYNTASGDFIRAPDTPLCAPTPSSGCRTASGAAVASDGRIYQTYFGSAAQSSPAEIFIYDATTYALVDSIAIPLLPSGIQVVDFP
jgi:hypothetical protein